ncbi:MAG: hypothetical protein CO113_17450 [Elusimicrobia bacterium CG_4_9_14_3_um_filter_62_55]|nr:MAG: hypothetical protein CO113_17450 [Elusimicrobia bacterium CG_4_9_14_3_um_filter_62_55]
MSPGDAAAHRLRIQLPSGASFEAEGSPGFIAAERQEFIALQAGRRGTSAAAESGPDAGEPAWETLLESSGQKLAMRAKLRGERGERDACLILLAAARTLLRERRPTAAQIARWLRASGYPIARVDRAIQASIDQGEILASGSRRARRYELSGPGLAKAFRLGRQHAAFIDPSGTAK